MLQPIAETLIEAIRAAFADGANTEARASGMQACRSILAALEARVGEPLARTPVAATPMHAVLGVLRSTPPEQLLDLLIAKLKAALPVETNAPAVQAVRIPLAPLAPPRGQP